jgi:hypothetical protein
MWRAVLAICLVAGCGGDPAPVIDAAVPDGAVAIDAPGLDAAAVGVPCGDTMFCVPSTSQGCCVEGAADPICEPVDGLCLGDLTSCDGPEDCTPGDVCCDYGQGPGCGDAPSCTADNGGTVICHGACN